jgi:glycosyltransferase involved in cell wall biosynthesis
MRILIATDAWHPQVNGVVRSIEALAGEARHLGANVEVLTPEGFPTIGMPTYPDIRLAFVTASRVGLQIETAAPDHVHIATEGPIGLAARRHCLRNGRLFTTSYHTRFPDYIAARAPVPRAWSYAWLRWFHNAGCGVMVSTPSIAAELRHFGFNNVMRWSRGVDHALFHPRELSVLDLPRPIFLYVGRVAVEKNIEAFLALDLPGSKVVAGDGPSRAELQQRYPDVTFLGVKTGEDLARVYASADVFVFPSRTDTFGIVLLEALASGLPVAAYPVPGPSDVIGDSDAGVLDEDLGHACREALKVPRQRARDFSLNFTWSASAKQFLDNVSAVRSAALAVG